MKMIEEHTIIGKLAVVCAIIAITLVFLDLLIIRGFINWIIPTILAITAIGLGDSAAEKGDKIGTIAIILGVLYFLIIIVGSILFYYYVNSLFS